MLGRCAVELSLDIRDNGVGGRRVGNDRVGGRHHSAAQLQSDFFPDFGMIRHVLHRHTLEREVAGALGVVVAVDAVAIDCGFCRRRELLRVLGSASGRGKGEGNNGERRAQPLGPSGKKAPAGRPVASRTPEVSCSITGYENNNVRRGLCARIGSRVRVRRLLVGALRSRRSIRKREFLDTDRAVLRVIGRL